MRLFNIKWVVIILWNGLFPSRNGTIEACCAVFKRNWNIHRFLFGSYRWWVKCMQRVLECYNKIVNVGKQRRWRLFHLSTATDQSSTKIQCSHCKLWNHWKHCIKTTDEDWQLKPTSNITSQNWQFWLVLFSSPAIDSQLQL